MTFAFPLSYAVINSDNALEALLTSHVMTEMHFLFQKNLKIIMHGRVKMYVMRLPFCWTPFLFDLAQSCIDK